MGYFYFVKLILFYQMITKNDKKLEREIRRYRKGQKMTQEELANKVGVTPKYIQYVEAARRIPSLKILYKIAKGLGVKVKELFTF